MLNEENYVEIINSYDRKHWQPLLDLIPEIESTGIFGKWAGGEQDSEGHIQFPYKVASHVVGKFQRLVDALGIQIVFDWSKWDDGRKIARNENFDFDSIDIPTKCKLITAIIRNNRFCEGALVAEFESGLILKILHSINRQIAAV